MRAVTRIGQDDRYVTRSELATQLRVSVSTIERWRREGMPSELWGPRAGTRRYPLESCLRWVRESARLGHGVP